MSTFRSLAPSQGEASASASTMDQSTATSSSGTGSGSGKGGDGLPRRRRTAGNVAHKACVGCRQARQKCDGVEPNSCSKCKQRRMDCVWEPHTKESKDQLIQQIVRLQSRNRDMTEATNRSEEEKRDYQQTSEWQGIILRTIGQDGHDREIIQRLRDGQSYHAVADWLVTQNPTLGDPNLGPSAQHTLAEVVKTFEDQHDGLQRTGTPPLTGTPWTDVSSDQRLIGHLFNLYFTWVHPVHMLFSELDFKRDFRKAETNDATRYCSQPLVNAICAMACHFLESGEDNNEISAAAVGKAVDAARLREHFMDKAKTGLTQENISEPTSVQTLAVMYLAEHSSGKARSAIGYLRLAAEGLDSADSGQSEEAWELTFWGIRTLITSVYRIMNLKGQS
ncbi:MAG: hypothetical protein Q9163_004113 [Psora crenata]